MRKGKFHMWHLDLAGRIHVGDVQICKSLICDWGSVSCPRTLQHADQGNRTSDHPITRHWPCATAADLLTCRYMVVIWAYSCLSDSFFKAIAADGENAFWATKLNCFSITHSLINACFNLENAEELEQKNTTQLEPISNRMWPLTPAFTFTLKWQNHISLSSWLSVEWDRPLPKVKPVQYQIL